MGRLYDATWGRAFTAAYDRGIRASEEAGLRQMRRELLADASGRTVELGAGTGANLTLYPKAVTELILVEPDPHMVRKLHSKLSEVGRLATVTEAPAERLPLEDSSFDTAVFTVVLCTVPDPDAALAEVARILRPGGRMLFIEHVRSEDAGLARRQDRFEKTWHFIADGCHCNRDTVATIEASPLVLEHLDHGHLPKAMPIVKPLVRGSALFR